MPDYPSPSGGTIWLGLTHLREVIHPNNAKLFDFVFQGKAEEAVKALDFERTCVYRPGLLMCERQESRAGEKLFQCLAGAVDKSEKYSIPTEKVAKAMLVNSLRSVIHA